MMAGWSRHIAEHAKEGAPHWFVLFNRPTGMYRLIHTWDGEIIYPGTWWNEDVFYPRDQVIVWYAGQFIDSEALQPLERLIDALTPIKVYAEGEKPSYGFIAPDGTYYACDFSGHSDLADCLAARLYPEQLERGLFPREIIEQAGFVMVHYKLATLYTEMTESQERVIRRALAHPEIGDFAQGFERLIAHVEAKRMRNRRLVTPGRAKSA